MANWTERLIGGRQSVGDWEWYTERRQRWRCHGDAQWWGMRTEWTMRPVTEHGRWDLQMCTDVYKQIQMCIGMYRSVQMWTDVYRCVHIYIIHIYMCTDMNRHIQTCTEVYRDVQVGTDMYSPVRISTDLYRPIQTYTDLYRPILTYTDLYWPIQSCIMYRRQSCTYTCTVHSTHVYRRGARIRLGLVQAGSDRRPSPAGLAGRLAGGVASWWGH